MLRKEKIGSKRERKLRKYSDNFNEMFNFFLKGYRSGLLTFCGVGVDVTFDLNADESKWSFRMFEDGKFKQKELVSRHPNTFRAVVVGKKSWGLWLQQWTDGITERSFTIQEILDEFAQKGITIPEPLLKDFQNNLDRKWRKQWNKTDGYTVSVESIIKDLKQQF